MLVLLENWQLTLKKKNKHQCQTSQQIEFSQNKKLLGKLLWAAKWYASVYWVCCICHKSFQVSAMYEGPIRLEDAILNNLWPFFFPFGSSLYWRGGADNFCS